MHDKMKVWVIIGNLFMFVWFVALHYYRFKDSGQACSGDYILYGIDNADFKFEKLDYLIQDAKVGAGINGAAAVNSTAEQAVAPAV